MLPVIVQLEQGDVGAGGVEGLCRGVLGRLSSRLPVRAEQGDDEDDLRWLIGEAWIRAQRFQERPGIEFGPWLYQQLAWALIDHWRSYWGRNGEKRVADLRFAERALRDGVDDGDPQPDRPDLVVAGGDRDAEELRVFPRGWVELPEDRGGGGPVGGLGRLEGAGATQGADPAGVRALAGRVGEPPRPPGGGAGGGRAFADCAGCGWRTYACAPNGRPGWWLPDRCQCGAELG